MRYRKKNKKIRCEREKKREQSDAARVVRNIETDRKTPLMPMKKKKRESCVYL